MHHQCCQILQNIINILKLFYLFLLLYKPSILYNEFNGEKTWTNPLVINNIISVINPVFIPRETVASQYFLELAGYVGLPVISWNADNAALEKVRVWALQLKILPHFCLFQSSFQLQLAPTIRHQAMAIMSLLQRWDCLGGWLGAGWLHTNNLIHSSGLAVPSESDKDQTGSVNVSPL